MLKSNMLSTLDQYVYPYILGYYFFMVYGTIGFEHSPMMINRVRAFAYDELVSTTKNFASVIGKGGFGCV